MCNFFQNYKNKILSKVDGVILPSPLKKKELGIGLLGKGLALHFPKCGFLSRI